MGEKQTMYYHISIETKDKEKLFEMDKKNYEDIVENIIIPYLQDKTFQFDGYFIDPQNIRRFIVKESGNSSKLYASMEKKNLPEGLIMHIDPTDIIEYDQYVTDITRKVFNEGKIIIKRRGYELPTSTEEVVKQAKDMDKTKVFIVHGHDELAVTSVALFIRKLNLTPIILHEQANEGKTIIEKIEAHSNVGFGIVLYTPCDVGSKKDDEDNLRPRARQNVVFEHGFLIGKIGRENVAAVVKDNEIEKPNDMSGIVYIDMDAHKAWEMKLAKEMKSSGYAIDMNRFFE